MNVELKNKDMIEYKKIYAISKYNRIGPNKIKKLLNLIKGKTYIESLRILLLFKKKSALIIWKVLVSAMSNAYQIFDMKKSEDLIKKIMLNKLHKFIIFEAFITRGSILKRTQPRAKGKSYKIEKIFSHITIILKQNKK